MRGVTVGLCLATCIAWACGGGSSGTPTPPSVDATSLAVTLRDVVLVGTTATATATATLSNGQTQTVNATWRSDATAVATVTSSGAVAGVANGEATIVAAFGGREGTKRIRVAPNYDGRWRGMQLITSCVATGDLVGICEQDGGVVGLAFPIGLAARHPGELAVSGEFTIEDQTFPTFTAQVEPDGSINFSGTLTIEGVRGEVSWQMNSTESGRATGSIREKYSAPDFLVGDVTLDSRLSDFNRSAAAASSVRPSAGTSTIRRRITAVLRR